MDAAPKPVSPVRVIAWWWIVGGKLPGCFPFVSGSATVQAIRLDRYLDTFLETSRQPNRMEWLECNSEDMHIKAVVSWIVLSIQSNQFGFDSKSVEVFQIKWTNQSKQRRPMKWRQSHSHKYKRKLTYKQVVSSFNKTRFRAGSVFCSRLSLFGRKVAIIWLESRIWSGSKPPNNNSSILITE